MSNLLDRSSIVLTPTAYDNGEVLCVKPSDGSGDFDFSRNSAATRVNEQGLVEDVQSLSSELVTNGNFATDSDWNKNSNWSISGGTANCDGTSNGDINQGSTVATIGKSYIITYDVVSISQGEFFFKFGGVNGTFRNSIGTYTETIQAINSNRISLDSLNNAIGSIDNVSVKEVIDNTNLPRINYEGFSFDGSGNIIPDSGCGSWLWEPQSTNLITQSELFSDSSWSKIQTNVEAATITLPDGLTNGFKLFANTSNSSHWLEKTPFPTATIGQDYTISLFVKSAGSDFIQIAASTGFSVKFQNFNLSTGAKASGNAAGSSITDFGNGWYRISVTENTIGTNARYLIIPALSDITRNATFQGNANKDGVYIWGAQIEEQSYATSYIPTDGTSVTRNKDLCTNGGSAASINSTEGVLYAEISALANDGTNREISISDGTTGSRITIRYRPTSGQIQAAVVSGGTTQAIITKTGLTTTNFAKVALKYSQNDFALWINGIEVGTDTSGLTPTGLNKLSFNIGIDGFNNFFGKTKCVAVWKEALTDTELQELTTI